MSNFKFIRHYFGISGCFKGTTIDAEIKEDKEDIGKNKKVAMKTDIKLWKSYESKFSLEQSDLNYAALYLCKLKNFIYDVEFPKFIRTILVERGVSDMIFYYLEREGNENKLNEESIRDFIKEEEILEEQNSYYKSEKILLVQNDIEFIKNVVLKEPTRAECFPGGVDNYLKQQEKYIEFTQKFNKITKTEVIKDAGKYLNELGLTFNPNVREK